MKKIKSILKSLLIGTIFIYAINYIGQYISFNIPVNLLNIAILGFLRIPGLIVVIIILKLYGN